MGSDDSLRMALRRWKPVEAQGSRWPQPLRLEPFGFHLGLDHLVAFP